MEETDRVPDRLDLRCSGLTETEIVDIVPKNRFWSELAARFKEHIESQIPSDEFYVSHTNGSPLLNFCFGNL